MNKNFWKEKKVLVTGATGFLGSNLTEKLVAAGAKVTAFVKPDDPIKLESIKKCLENIITVNGDLRDKEAVHRAVEGQDIIFHLGALTQVIYSLSHPAETMETNFTGTLHLAEALRSMPKPPFLVYASTDKVYGEPKYLPINEEHPLFGKSPYDASKIAADCMLAAYNQTYGLPVTKIRSGNIYGPRDANILRAVPDFITAILTGQDILIRGSGEHRRDYLYVDDVANAYLLAAENQKKTCGQAFNLGKEEGLSVKELAQAVSQAAGGATITIAGKSTPGEIDTQVISYQKIKKALGWEPKTELAEGLRKTLEWYKNNPEWLKVMDRVSAYYGLDIQRGG